MGSYNVMHIYKKNGLLRDQLLYPTKKKKKIIVRPAALSSQAKRYTLHTSSFYDIDSVKYMIPRC